MITTGGSSPPPAAPPRPKAVAPVPHAATAQQQALELAAWLRRFGVTHLVWLPDSEAGFLYDAVRRDPDVALVPVCREGEAMAVALGLMVGGQRPAVVIQNTGFFESGDSVRGVMLDSGFPFFVMIGYRGWKAGAPMTDSAGIYLDVIPARMQRCDAPADRSSRDQAG